MALSIVNVFGGNITAVPTADYDWYKVPFNLMTKVSEDTTVLSNGDTRSTATYQYNGGVAPDEQLTLKLTTLVDNPRKAKPQITCSLYVSCSFKTTSTLTDEVTYDNVGAQLQFHLPVRVQPLMTSLAIANVVSLTISSLFGTATAGAPGTAIIDMLRRGSVASLLAQSQS